MSKVRAGEHTLSILRIDTDEFDDPPKRNAPDFAECFAEIKKRDNT